MYYHLGNSVLITTIFIQICKCCIIFFLQVYLGFVDSVTAKYYIVNWLFSILIVITWFISLLHLKVKKFFGTRARLLFKFSLIFYFIKNCSNRNIIWGIPCLTDWHSQSTFLSVLYYYVIQNLHILKYFTHPSPSLLPFFIWIWWYDWISKILFA